MSQEEQVSTSPQGGHENGDEAKFQIISVHHADLEIAEIQHFTSVPDYQTLSILSTPVVATANGRYHCVDGWNLVEKAINEGQTHIMCQVITIPDDTEAVLAWAKSYIRTASLDSNASYAERGRNITITRDLLLKEGFIKIRHGGARKGKKYSEATERNIVRKLAKIFKRSERTIKNYLDHFEHLNAKCIDNLVKENVTKSFFEAIESAKAAFITEKSDLHDEMTMPEVVSAQTLEWLGSFDKKTGKVQVSDEVKAKRSAGIEAAESSPKDPNRNNNGALPSVMESEKQTISSPPANLGEGIKDLFSTRRVSDGGAEEGKDKVQEAESLSGPTTLAVIQGGGEPLENEVNNVYLSIDKLGEQLKSVAQSRPHGEQLAGELNQILDELHGIIEMVQRNIKAAAYYSLGDAA